ncbi:ArsR/SmtB family transcription factor [Rathayibacter sp. KR2-224]|uniref:ArsR/SmtB family transcription factor n=1 Tax=Rathayibacter sp. KR2-224 TaxID=3400913 RepID=UPI003C101E93
MEEKRVALDDPRTVAALAHPVRLDLLGYLMSEGPATASECARAIGDNPSNCSYHLRVLGGLGLVEDSPSDDGRERRWRATITGFTTDPATAGSDELFAASIQSDYQAARQYLRERARLDERWREADAHAHYGLRVTPDELSAITRRIDAIVRPYIAAVRDDAPPDAETVNLSLLALPRPRPGAQGSGAEPMDERKTDTRSPNAWQSGGARS